MFICSKCLTCKSFHMSGSYGRCELCGKVRECADCPSWHDLPEPEPKPKKRKVKKTPTI